VTPWHFRGDERAGAEYPLGRRRRAVGALAADSSGCLWQEVEIVEAEEGAAYGAAILAGVGAKLWPSVDDACRSVVRVAKRIPANSANVARMNESYATYRKVYPATRSIFSA